MADHEHRGDVIAAPDLTYAYQHAPVRPLLVLEARPAQRGDPAEYRDYAEYRLEFARHTGNALTVTLRKIPHSEVFCRQRDERGYGTNEEIYTTTFSFQEICNRLLGPGCFACTEDEAFPEAVKAAMRGVYSRKEVGGTP